MALKCVIRETTRNWDQSGAGTWPWDGFLEGPGMSATVDDGV